MDHGSKHQIGDQKFIHLHHGKIETDEANILADEFSSVRTYQPKTVSSYSPLIKYGLLGFSLHTLILPEGVKLTRGFEHKGGRNYEYK